jgi:magnesium chelatase family protein
MDYLQKCFLLKLIFLGGLPTWGIVGLPDTSVKESKERIKSAIKNTGLRLESRRIIINLSPADTKKEGAIYDLPMAIGILLANGDIENINLEDTILIGELSLSGKVNRINGAFPIALEAEKIGMKRIILPKENAKEASIVQNIEVIGVESLKEVIEYLTKKKNIARERNEINNIFNNNSKYNVDFKDIKGQENVKRALEVAAAGGHNVLLVRTSSVLGKTFSAKCLPSILPDLELEESLEITKIHSVAGLISENMSLITKRPFRAPHHTISSASLVRTEEIYQSPGEISLSHGGVLFLDELTEFSKYTLELLRGPLEDRNNKYK